MTLIWISLLPAIAFIGGLFAAKFIFKHRSHTELDDTIIKLLDITDPHQAPEYTTAAVKELKHAYVVIANINGIEVALKQFPKGDSPRLAQISAEELADEIMND